MLSQESKHRNTPQRLNYNNFLQQQQLLQQLLQQQCEQQFREQVNDYLGNKSETFGDKNHRLPRLNRLLPSFAAFPRLAAPTASASQARSLP